MHIAFFSDQHPGTLGGLQTSIALQRTHLERLGHRVTVCAPDSRHVANPGHVRPHDVILRARQVGEHSFSLAGDRYATAIDAEFSRLPPVDLVHVQADVWGAWNGYRFADRHELPIVHTMHTNIEEGLPAIMPFPRACFRLLFAAQQRYVAGRPIRSVAEYATAFAERADALIAPSEHFADRLRGYGVTREIHVLPTGVDDPTIDVLRRFRRPRRGRPVLVWPGRISREKRLHEFLAAFARVRHDAEVHVYGSGPDSARCRQFAEQSGLGGRVRFFGAVDHLAALTAMRDAEAVVQSSVGYETQGLTAYEAASLGTPTLLRDRTLARDLPAPLRFAAADTAVGSFAVLIEEFLRLDRRRRSRPAPTDRFLQSALSERAELLYRLAIEAHARKRSSGGGRAR